MLYAFGNAQHIGAREQQQDAFGFSEPEDAALVSHGGFLAVLADGMGGLERGDAASRAAAQAFLETYRTKTPGTPIPSALSRSLEAANEAVFELARRWQLPGEIGTTLVAAVLDGSRLFWVSVGDSALFLWREGVLTQLNIPHVYARELDAAAAAGRIAPAAAQADPRRDALTSHLGMARIAEIDLRAEPLEMHEDDCLLLATDGLFKTLSEDAIARSMRGTLQQRCESLVRRTLEQNAAGQDNVTVLALARREPMDLAHLQPAQRGGKTRRSSTIPFGKKLLVMGAAAALVFGFAALHRWNQRSGRQPAGGASPAQPVGERFDPNAYQPPFQVVPPDAPKASLESPRPGVSGSGRSGREPRK